jgi:hypothetical protein
LKKLIAIFFIILLILSILIFSKEENIENNEMMISILQDLIWDEKISTGPIPPIDYDKGLEITSLKNPVFIDGVPKYLWLNGCAPTSAGMLIGYWDSQGFDDLVDGDAYTQTNSVNNMISSSGNYYDYCLPKDSPPNLLPDKSEPPLGDEHDDDCIADFMKTSQSYCGNYYAVTSTTHIDDAIFDYIIYRNPEYEPKTHNYVFSRMLWDKYCIEIDEGRPVVLTVDIDGDGETDHAIIGVGYDENINYACYNTWDKDIHWYDFSPKGNGNKWGISYLIFCSFNFYPYQPLNPQPTNGSINIDGNIVLSWECEDLDSDNLYHIYLSNNMNFDEDDLLITNLTEKYYNINNLEDNTKYYWKVVAEDKDDITTESKTWCFYTKDTHPPNINLINPIIGNLYISGNEKRETRRGGTIIIGKISLNFNVSDNLLFDRVELYINNVLKYSDINETCHFYMWDDVVFGKHNLSIIAYDASGNNIYYCIDVWKFF